MSANNTLEADVASMVMNGADPAWRAAATGYVALFTADPTETGSLAAECNDATYARVAVTKATGTVNANITSVNGVAIDGAGTELNPWGPA